jgi:hypothetical protein
MDTLSPPIATAPCLKQRSETFFTNDYAVAMTASHRHSLFRQEPAPPFALGSQQVSSLSGPAGLA